MMTHLMLWLIGLVVVFFIAWYLAIKFAMIAIAFFIGVFVGFALAKFNILNKER
jgi:hypothetical protein